MGRTNPFAEAPFVGCCVLAFCLPFTFIYATIAIWCLAICWLLSGQYRATAKAFKAQPAYWLWTAFFALWALSGLWSDDKGEAQFDTVSKLSFVLLPWLVGYGARLPLRRLAVVLLWFVAGICVVEWHCLNQANIRWQEDGNLNHFLYHDLTYGMDANAVYMAWYVIGALSALLVFPWEKAGLKRMKGWRWLPILFLSFFLALLSSRLLVVLFLFVVIPTYGLWYYRNAKRSVWMPIFAIAVVALLADALVRTNNPIHERFVEVAHSDLSVLRQDSFYNRAPQLTNLTLRLFVWRIALENMNERHLWLHGCGNGDVHTIQNDQIRRHGVPGMREEEPHSPLVNVNLHNMYLQTLITLGLPGLLLFLVLAFGPFFFLHRSEAGYFFALFHTVAVLFMMQESALQTQQGFVFYCFFTALFWSSIRPRIRVSKSIAVKGKSA